MRPQRYWIAAGLFLLLATTAAVFILTGKGNTVQAARETVEAFCRNEFEGGEPETHERLVRYSPAVEAEFQKSEHPWLAKHVTTPPLVVVSAYEVKDVRVEGDRATAVVAYRRLARSDNHYHRPYFPDRKDNDLVTLNLVFDKGWRPSGANVSFVTAAWNAVFTKDQWWVLDPPAQRVSKRVVLEYYEEEVKRDFSMWEQKLNDPSYSEKQKANVRASRDRVTGNLRLLKSLP